MKPYEVEAIEEWTLPGQGASALRVGTPCGDIRIRGTDSEQIEVRVVKQVRAAREEEARAFLALMRVEHQLDGDCWMIEAGWPEARHHGVESPQARFELRVPARMAAEARSGHGAVEVSDVSAARLRSGSGDLRADRITGDLEAQTGHGSVHVETCGSLVANAGSGTIEAHRISGPLKVTTGHGAVVVEECAGTADISARSGDIRVQAVRGRLEAVSGHGRIAAADIGEARLRTSSGDIEATRVNGPLETRTGHGRIVVEDCQGPLASESSSGDVDIARVDSEVRASTGHGSIRAADVAAASLRSSSGDVVVSRAAGPVTARTGHGQIALDDCHQPIDAETRSGSIELQQTGGVVRAQTGHGAIAVALSPDAGPTQVELSGCGPIELSLPGSVSARLEAHTHAGTIESDPIPDARIDPRRGHLEATLGAGEGLIRLRTSHGNIRIRRTIDVTAPPTPASPAVR